MSQDIRRWKNCIIIFIEFQMFSFFAQISRYLLSYDDNHIEIGYDETYLIVNSGN